MSFLQLDQCSWYFTQWDCGKNGSSTTMARAKWIIRLVAVIVDGKDTPTSPATINTVTDEGWIVTVDGKLYSKGTSKRDPQFPNHSDVVYAEGALAGTTTKQITKIEGDVMLACAGEKRPTEFKSKPGSGHTLSLWIRVK